MTKNFTFLKMTLLAVIMMAGSVGVSAQTTLDYTFSAVSGTIDANIAFTTQTNGASAPAYNTSSNQLRLYSVRASGNGNTITFTPSNGALINSVKLIKASDDQSPSSVTCSVDGATPVEIKDTYSISGINATTSVVIKNAHTGGSSNLQMRLTGVEIIYTLSTTEPTLSYPTTPLSGFTYVEGNGPSEEVSFTVSGSNLSADINISNTGNPIEISLTSGSGFADDVTIPISGGSIASTTVYARLKAGEPVGSGTVNIMIGNKVDGVGGPIECAYQVTEAPLVAPTANAATDISQIGFTASWDAVPVATSGYELSVYTKESGGSATDLFFSEYIEGSSNNKYLEIFNGTGHDVDLSDYVVETYTNGETTVKYTQDLSGTLATVSVYVIGNAGGTIYTTSNITSTVTYYNGDDAVALKRKSTNSFVDIIGSIGHDPGTNWSAGALATSEQTLVRKSTVSGGVTTNPATGFPTLAAEWDSYPQDDASHLGSHTFDGVVMAQIAGSPFTIADGATTSYIVSGLDNSKTYYYTLKSLRGAEKSILSNEIEVNLLSTGLSNAKTSANAWTLPGKIMLHASAGETIEVFNVTGQKMVSRLATEGLNSVDVPVKGVVIVKVSNRVSKVVLDK